MKYSLLTLRSFSPEQRKGYYKAQKEHVELAHRFKRAVGQVRQAVAEPAEA